MALQVADRVQELSTTSGTGTLTLNGAVPGFQTFSAGIGNTNTTYYTIYDPTTYDWEVGIGTVGAGTLSRDTVLSNSLGTTALINLAGNQVNVFATYPAEKAIYYNASGEVEVGAPISYADTGIIATFASTVAGYNQVIFQNKSTAINASANVNVSNDASSATDGFAELGINSSTFSNGPGCFNIPNAAYVASAGADLSIGTYNAYDIHFATNSSTTDAMTIFDNGGTSLGGYGNPGIGNLAVNKIVSGVSQITASAGTTILNAASTYYQHVVGTTTQTIQLPDATTLLNGTTFIVDNDSTGNVTITDFATSSLDVLPPGGLAYFYLYNNSTVAGSWTAHGYLPSIYNFNNTTADFGNATIINAVWNGTAIDPGYGGTGLTTFGGANNALYSTGATTLTAGTLPVAAGGTGNTSGQAASVANALSAGTGLNFTGGGSFDGSAAKTINLADTAVTPASYTYASITVDAQGRLTAASSGTAPVTSVGATAPVASSGGTTPTISMTQSSSTVNGWLSSTDWNTFNGKQAAYTNLTSIGSLANAAGWLYNNGSGTFTYTTPSAADVGAVPTSRTISTTAPLAGGGDLSANRTFSITQATGSTDGYLSSTDWNTFNNKGTVTSVSGTGGYGGLTLSGTVTSSGNITLGGTPSGTWPISVSGNSATVTNGLYTTGGQTIAARTIQQGSQNVGTLLTATGSLGGFELQSASSTDAAFMTFHRPGNYASYFGIDTDNQFAVGGWSAGAALANFKAGSLGIGTAASGTTGEIRATNNITAYFSDERFKTKLGNIDDALAKVMTLDGFYYEANELAQSYGYEVKKEVGVSAQQVQAVMPEVVAPAPIDENYLTVRYERLVPLLIEAIKELKAEVDELKKAR